MIDDEWIREATERTFRGYWDKESYRHVQRRIRMLNHYRWDPPEGCHPDVITRFWPIDLASGKCPRFKWPIVRRRSWEKLLWPRLNLRGTKEIQDHCRLMESIPVFDERGTSREHWYYHLRVVAKYFPKRYIPSVITCRLCKKRSISKCLDISPYDNHHIIQGFCSKQCYDKASYIEWKKEQKRRVRQWQQLQSAKESLKKIRSYLANHNPQPKDLPEA